MSLKMGGTVIPKKIDIYGGKICWKHGFQTNPNDNVCKKRFPIYLGTKIWVMGQQVKISCFRRPGSVSSLRSSQPRGDFDIKKVAEEL